MKVQIFIFFREHPRFRSHTLEVRPENQRDVVLKYKQMNESPRLASKQGLPDSNPEKAKLNRKHDYVS